jgi:hypothetical protein
MPYCNGGDIPVIRDSVRRLIFGRCLVMRTRDESVEERNANDDTEFSVLVPLSASATLTVCYYHEANLFAGITISKTLERCLSRMTGNYHVRFLGGKRGRLRRIGASRRSVRKIPMPGMCGRTRRIVRIRSRVEHVFGGQAKRAGDLIVRAIGLIRVKAKVGLRNLACNLDRYCVLAGT